MLKRNGHNVQILEQTAHELEHQAAGVVSDPPLQRFLDKFDRRPGTFSMPCEGISAINNEGEVTSFTKLDKTINSWDAIYHRLRWNFDGLQSEYCPDLPPEASRVDAECNVQEGSATYRAGCRLVGLEVSPEGAVTANFEDARTGVLGKTTADLLVGADGANSSVRDMVLVSPVQRQYAGYVLWRGVVEESKISDKSRKQFEKNLTFLTLSQQYLIA